jgi:hypothetical protein
MQYYAVIIYSSTILLYGQVSIQQWEMAKCDFQCVRVCVTNPATLD